MRPMRSGKEAEEEAGAALPRGWNVLVKNEEAAGRGGGPK
jgi:hypothetical protein